VVLGLGRGAGTDLRIAAQMTAPEGRVIGVDLTAASARELESLRLPQSPLSNGTS
jgi:hypothetical protein